MRIRTLPEIWIGKGVFREEVNLVENFDEGENLSGSTKGQTDYFWFVPFFIWAAHAAVSSCSEAFP